MKVTGFATGQWCLAVVVMAAASFVLNWAWEMVQMRAYVEMAGRTWSETAYRCTVATLGDVVVTLAIYGLGVVASMRIWWGLTVRWNEAFAAALMGAACAIAIEWKAIGFSEWS